MVRSELNIRIRCGVRVFLECHKGEYFTGKEIAFFLQDKLGMNKSTITANQISRLVKMDRTNINGILHVVDIKVMDGRNKYAIL